MKTLKNPVVHVANRTSVQVDKPSCASGIFVMNNQKVKNAIEDYLFSPEEKQNLLNQINEVEEIWKDISGYDGFYQVSNLGRVKSLYRSIPNNRGSETALKERIMRQNPATDGYLSVNLSKNSKCRIAYVHLMVAKELLGLESCRTYVIDHKDEDKHNNRSTNLQKISFRDNVNKSFKNAGYEFTGTTKIGKKYAARVTLLGVSIHLGMYETVESANSCYQRALFRFNHNEDYYKRCIHILPSKEKRKYLLT